jgi:glyoxylase-like metal-dependent hydrolase (beta-lactamase superfamily II)
MKVRVYEGDIKVQSFVLGNIHPHLTLPTTTVNSWLVHLPQGRLLIDAGPPWAGRLLARELIRRNLEPKWVALTHAHIDHAGGICDLLKLIPSARFLAQEADIPVLSSGEVLVPSFINPFTPIRPAIHWAFTRRPMPKCHPDGDLSELADLGIEVLQTPGHSLPHASLLLPDGSLMAGDALAVNPAGRPVVNAFYEDQDLMLESLQILARRGSGRVFAGHGVPCSIEQVRSLVENTIHSGPKKPLKRKTI